ncbi:MAG TPA: SCO1664 family protein [Ilumatobacteraceae bacterium]|nr:SCO1664 family protein [Ilumatobacteraceae bacterium]
MSEPSPSEIEHLDDEFDDDEFDDDEFDGDEDDADERGVELRVDAIEDPIAHLLRGDIEIEGRMPYSSNATFLVHVVADGRSHPAIYKPTRGERPLWDFEPGLHRREVATYLLSEALGLGVIPPTVLRDGPLGEGSVQWFITADHSQHYFTIHETHPDLHDRLRAMALLDVLANNTDRKSGHVLLIPEREGEPASVWGIDNGLCFASDDKLRTVIWEFGGEEIPDAWLELVATFCERVPPEIAALLAADEVEALQRRAGRCVVHRRFPTDPSGRRYPWPLV